MLRRPRSNWAEPAAAAPDDMPGADATLIGRLLAGRWRVQALIGRGGMASVYRATHRNGRTVALKVLRRDLALDERARSRFLREGYIANRVGHPGAVAVLDEDVTDDGVVFLVMDFLEGETLEQHCRTRGGQLPVDDVLAIADALLAILESAHARGVVHRDIKPANLFLTTKGELKLLDFGIARAQEVHVSSITRSGVLLGTPGYLAPEQARGRWNEVDPRTDLWAVGATMYRALTGQSPHHAATPNEAVIAAATQPVPSLGFACPTLSVGIVDWVDTALRAQPNQRWQTAAGMRAALKSVGGHSGTFSVPRPLSPNAPDTADEAPSSSDERWRQVYRAQPSPHAFSRSRKSTVVAASTVLAAGGIMMFVWLRGRSPVTAPAALSAASAAAVLDATSQTIKSPEMNPYESPPLIAATARAASAPPAVAAPAPARRFKPNAAASAATQPSATPAPQRFEDLLDDWR